jgi:hypothetical protein
MAEIEEDFKFFPTKILCGESNCENRCSLEDTIKTSLRGMLCKGINANILTSWEYLKFQRYTLRQVFSSVG